MMLIIMIARCCETVRRWRAEEATWTDMEKVTNDLGENGARGDCSSGRLKWLRNAGDPWPWGRSVAYSQKKNSGEGKARWIGRSERRKDSSFSSSEEVLNMFLCCEDFTMGEEIKENGELMPWMEALSGGEG